MKSYSFGLLCVMFPLAYGCGADPTGGVEQVGEPAPKEATSSEVSASTSTVVAHVNLSATHDVEILESDDGFVAIAEKGAMGVDKPSVDLRADPGKSLAALYEQLQAQAVSPETSKVDMKRLLALDEIKAAAPLDKTPVAPPQDEIVEKASLWQNYLSWDHDLDSTWAWWSSGPCNRHTYRCEMGLNGSWTFTKVDDYITYSHFNISTTTSSSAAIRRDLCYGGIPGIRCTTPNRTLVTLSVPPWSWGTIQAYTLDGDDHRYIAAGEGDVYAWAITYDNPRTW